MTKLLKSIILLTVIMAFLANGCSSKTKLAKITIGTVSNMGPAQGIVMAKRGFLEQELGGKYEIQSGMMGESNAIFEDLKEEKYDFVFTQYNTIGYFAKASHYQSDNYVLVANLADGDTSTLFARNGINSIEQLKGKTVGILKYSYPSTLILANTLKEHGLDITDRKGTVKIRYGNINDLHRDYQNGKIDACFDRIVFDQNANVLATYNDMAYKGAPSACLLVRKDFLKDNPLAVEKFLEAAIESTEWIKQHPDEAANLVWNAIQNSGGEGVTYSKEDLISYYNKLHWNIYPNLSFINDVWSYMESCTCKKPIPKEKVVDFVPLDKALTNKKMPPVKN